MFDIKSSKEKRSHIYDTNINLLVSETMESYYDYVTKLEAGCVAIVHSFKNDVLPEALQGVINLSEGLSWLLEAEKLLEVHSFKIESPIQQISPLFSKISSSIEDNHFDEVVRLIESELMPLFKNAG